MAVSQQCRRSCLSFLLREKTSHTALSGGAGNPRLDDGRIKRHVKMKGLWILLALFLVGMGVFNGISTWIEGIVRPRGFSISQAGNLGGVLLLGGIIGAAVIPLLSDRLHKRKVFLVLGLILAIPGW